MSVCLQGGEVIFTSAFFYLGLFSRDNCPRGWDLLTLSFGLTEQCLVYFLHDWSLLQTCRVIYHSDWFSFLFFLSLFFSSPSQIKGGGRGKIEISWKPHGYQHKYTITGGHKCSTAVLLLFFGAFETQRFMTEGCQSQRHGRKRDLGKALTVVMSAGGEW